MITIWDSKGSSSGVTISRPTRFWIGIGALLGLLGVIAGAAGTHALRGSIDAGALNTFETAVRFQMYHAFALLVTGLMADRWPSRWINAAGCCS